MRWAVLVVVASCYRPAPEAGAPCSPEGLCPSALACVAGVCTTPGGGGGSADARTPDAMRVLDAPHDAAADAHADAPLADGKPIDGGSGPDPSLILHYTFDDSPSDGTSDTNGRHPATCSACPTTALGEFGSAFHFNDQFLIVAPADATDLVPGTGFTLSMWIRPTAVTASGSVLAGRLGSAGDSYFLGLGSSSPPVVGYILGGNTLTNGSHAISLLAWHHVAMTWDGTTRQGWVDGVLDSTTAISTTIVPTSDLYLGGVEAGAIDAYLGDMDEVRFYTRALTPAEIAVLATPPTH